jgi:hypothetical protein
MDRLRAFLRWLSGRSSGLDVELAQASASGPCAEDRPLSIPCPCGRAAVRVLKRQLSVTHVRAGELVYMHLLCRLDHVGMRCVHCAAKLVRSADGYEWIEPTEPN